MKSSFWPIMFRSRRKREIEFDLLHTKFDREGAPLTTSFKLIFRKYRVDRFRIMPRPAVFETVFDSEDGYVTFAGYAFGKEQIKIWLPKGYSNV